MNCGRVPEIVAGTKYSLYSLVAILDLTCLRQNNLREVVADSFMTWLSK